MERMFRRVHPTFLAGAVVLAIAACSTSNSRSSGGATAPVPSTGATAPVSATSPALSRHFTSPIYGYTMGVAADWTVQPASILADDPASTEATGTDVVTVTGTDTTIETVVSDLGGETFEAWLQEYRAAVTPNVPPGCDGGDPSSWPSVTVGDRQGVWQQKCNAAVAIVEDGGKAYQFAWENSSFTDAAHLSATDFKAVLQTVTFPQPAPPASTAP